MSVTERKSAPQIAVGCVAIVDIATSPEHFTGGRRGVIDFVRGAALGCPGVSAARGARRVRVALRENGVTLAFLDGPVLAFQCALHLQAEAKARGIEVTVSLDQGDIEFSKSGSNHTLITGDAAAVALHALGNAGPGDIVATQRTVERLQGVQLPVGTHFAEWPKSSGRRSGSSSYRLARNRNEVPLSKYGRFLPRAEYLLAKAKMKGHQDLAPRETVAKRLYKIWRSALITSLFFVIFLAIHYAAEHFKWDHQLQVLAYDVLTAQLERPGQLPVRVVDIQQDFNVGKTYYTDFDRLGNLINKMVARPEWRPKAIAIDIDFGFDEKEDDVAYLLSKRRFTRRMKDLSTKCPIYLGVARGLQYEPSLWLGGEEFRNMAVSARRPKDLEPGQIEMSDEIHVGSNVIPSMASMLAKAAGDRRPNRPFFASEYSRNLVDEDFQASLYYLNSSAYTMLDKQTLLAKKLESSDPPELRELPEQVVIIGTTTEGDNSVLPGQLEAKPAVYLHALAADTLIRQPLFALGIVPRAVLSLGFLVAMMTVVLGMRIAYVCRAEEVAHKRLSTVWLWVLVAAALIGGLAFIRLYRVLWLDFLFVAALLVMHPRVEHFLIEAYSRLSEMLPRRWHDLVFGGSQT